MLLIGSYYSITLYLNLSQELKRLQLTWYSPIISKIVELYRGLTTFRLLGKVDFQRKHYRHCIDTMMGLFLHERYTLVLIFFFNGLIMSLFIFLSFLLIVSAKVYQWGFLSQDIGFISVTLNWILIIPNFVDLFMFFYSQFSQSISSVERMLFNVDEKTFEGPLETKSPLAFDPNRGIEVQNVFCKYRPNLPFVLKGLSLDIRPKEKVALVGRTGSGKSTFLLALTRILNVRNSRQYGKIKEYQQIQDTE